MLNKYLASTLRKNLRRLHYSSETGMFDVDIDTILKVSLSTRITIKYLLLKFILNECYYF